MTTSKQLLDTIRFWTVSFAGWAFVGLVVALFPTLQLAAMLLLALILTIKAVSLIHGIAWIWEHGAQSTRNLLGIERSTPPPSQSDRAMMVFAEFAATSDQRSAFGIFDWRWFKTIEVWNSRDGLWGTASLFLRWTRNWFYRFEALMVLSAMALVMRPYSECNWRSGALATAIVIAVLVNVTAMSAEVLLGNVIMGRFYDRYCHRHVERELDYSDGDGRELLKSVWNFVRLAAFSLLAIAAVLQSLHIADSFYGFEGIKSYDKHVPSAPTNSSPLTRLGGYSEFVAFTLTTFATVGYGDVHPLTIRNRLVVGYLHVLGMGMILVLLQLVLSQRGVREDAASPATARPSSPTTESRNETSP